jgi:hypothetical protein
MSEDCLTLNIYTPKKAGHKNVDVSCKCKNTYPVLVWIHGGFYQAYSAGSPYFNGLNLASTAGIIVVTLNYRLGMVLVFTCEIRHSSEVSPHHCTLNLNTILVRYILFCNGNGCRLIFQKVD